MSALEHLSPAQLRAHVQKHLEERRSTADWPEEYDTPECAEGECGVASEEYAKRAIKDGHQTVLHTYFIPDDAPRDLSTHFFPGHTVAHVQTSRGPYVVDLTHRQYDANAPYPIVEPQHEFLKRESMQPFTTYKVHKKGKRGTWFDSDDLPIQGRE